MVSKTSRCVQPAFCQLCMRQEIGRSRPTCLQGARRRDGDSPIAAGLAFPTFALLLHDLGAGALCHRLGPSLGPFRASVRFQSPTACSHGPRGGYGWRESASFAKHRVSRRSSDNGKIHSEGEMIVRTSADDTPWDEADISTSAKYVRYFAYGANMSPSVLTGRRGVTPIFSLPARAVALADEDGGSTQSIVASASSEAEGPLHLSFSHRAGFGTIVTSPGVPQQWKQSPGVHGVLHVLTKSELKRISSAETGYGQRTVIVETSTRIRCQAICFISRPSQALPTSVPPTDRYISLLKEGAAHHGVDEQYRAWLEDIPVVPASQALIGADRTRTRSKAVADGVAWILTLCLLFSCIFLVFK